MHSLIVSQTATEIPPEQVVEKAAQVIDAFQNLGVFMAVLLVIALFIIVVLVLVWSNRKTGQTALDVVSVSNADKIREIQEMREELREERTRQQNNHDQFMAALTVLAGKQTEITTGVQASETRVTGQVVATGTDVINKVEASRDDVLNVLRLLGKLNTGVFQPVSTEPPDLATMQTILVDALKSIELAQKRQQENPATAIGVDTKVADDMEQVA